MPSEESNRLILELISQLRNTQDRILDMQERHTQALAGMAEEMAGIRAKLQTQQACPGTCERIKLEVDHLRMTYQEKLDRIGQDLEAVREQCAGFAAIVEQAKGGRRVLVLAGSLIAFLSSVGGWAAGKILIK